MRLRGCVAWAVATVMGLALITVTAGPAAADAPPIWGTPATLDTTSGGPGPLRAVDCTAVGECVGVGNTYSFDSAAVIFTSGTHSDVTRLADAGTLADVDCVTGLNCIAVGQDGTGFATYIDFNSGSPTGMTRIYTSGFGSQGELLGVSCVTINNCTAVGRDSDGHAIAVEKSAGTWGTPEVIASMPGGTGVLNSVSCTSAQECVAVGQDGTNQPIYVVKTLGVWGAPSNLSPSGTGILRSVSCTSATHCIAVGQRTTGNLPIVVEMSGGVWGALTPMTPTGGTGGWWSIDCVNEGDCVVVGQDTGGTGPFPMYAVMNASAWGSLLTSPAPTTSGDGAFYGVSCVTSSQCFAVGQETENLNPIYTTTTSPITIVVYGDPSSTRPAIAGGGTLGDAPAARMAGYTGLTAANGAPITVSPECGLDTPTATEALAGTPDGTYWAPPPTCSSGTPSSFTVSIDVIPGSCLITAGLPAGTYTVGSDQSDLGTPFGTKLPDGSGVEAYRATTSATARQFALSDTVGVYLPAARSCGIQIPLTSAQSTTNGAFVATTAVPLSTGGSSNLTTADTLGITGFNRLLVKPLDNGSGNYYGGSSNNYIRCGATNISATALSCQLGPPGGIGSPGGVRVDHGGFNGRWNPAWCQGQTINMRSRVMTQMGYSLWSDFGTLTTGQACS